MRAGKMRHSITVQRSGMAPNDFGTVVETPWPVCQLRAEVIRPDQDTRDTGARAGSAGRAKVTFRTRYFADIRLTDKVHWRGKVYDLADIVEIQPARGLDLICEGPA